MYREPQWRGVGWRYKCNLVTINLFLIGGYLLYYIVLVSAIYQHESAVGIYMSSPSRTSLPPPTPSHPSRLSQSTGLTSLCPTVNFHCLSNFTCANMYVSMLLSQFIPPAPSPFHKSVLYVCISTAALQIGSSMPFF